MNPHSETPSPARRELTELMDKRLAGSITPGEQTRLEDLLRENPEALADYLDLVSVEALLPDAVVPMQAHASASNVIDRRRRDRWARVVLGAAASLVVAAGVSFWVTHRASEATRVATTEGVPASVSRSVGARWAKGGATQGARLSEASGELSAGFAELTFESGVRLLVEGPAAFEVTGPNACKLAYGKAVADVPPGAQGFTLDAPGERIIDHGTRFAVSASQTGDETLVGVFSGEVEVRRGARDLRLYTDYALQRQGDSLLSVPFRKADFVTEPPGREFEWNLDGVARLEPRELRFDVSRLIHGPGEYRAVFKWLVGLDALSIRSVALFKDGVAVCAAAGEGRTGIIRHTFNNAPLLSVPAAQAGPGKWELVAVLALHEGREGPTTSRGVVSLEEGLSTRATARDFVGRWQYSHHGDEFMREFGADGLCRITINGKPYQAQHRIPYSVEGGVLTVFPPGAEAPEKHRLRDDGTLVFLNLPYRNARRTAPGKVK